MIKRVLLLLGVGLTQLMLAQVPSYVPTNGLVGYWPFNGNANDESGNGNNGTVNGATLTADRFGNPNSAYQFNGSGNGNSIVIPNSSSLNFTGQMSFSFWIKFSNPQPLATIICRYTGSNPINGYRALLASPSGNKARWDIGNGILPDYGGSSEDEQAGIPLNDGGWHNIFGTFGSVNNNASNYQNLFVDGIWVDSTSLLQNGIGNIIQNLTIGKDPAYGNLRNFTGVIDDVCIWNVVVPDNGITYTNSNLTCAPNYFNTQNLVGYWPFCGNAYDETGHGNNGTVNGAVLTTNRFGISNTAYSFNNNVITLPSNVSYNSNQFTVSAWFNCTDDTIYDYYTIFSNYSGSSSSGFSGFWMGLLGNKADIFIGDGANGVDITSGISSNDGLWHLMTATRNGNTFSLYLDGVLQNSQIATMAIGNSPPMIGNSTLNEEFIGKIDDVIFWNRVINPSEMNTILSYYNCPNDLALTANSNSLNIGSTVFLNANTSALAPSFVWQSNFGQGWVDLLDYGNYNGVSTNQLAISNVQLSNHYQPVRAIVYSGACIDTSNTINIQINNPCTSTVTVYDTINVTIVDTTTVTQYDTVTTYLSVTDTLIINQTLTGLVAPNNMNTIKIFPNPTNDHVTINYGNYALMNGYTLNITNALGQVVFTSPINLASSYLDLSTWGGSGTYFVHILNPQGTTVNTRKIVLQ